MARSAAEFNPTFWQRLFACDAVLYIWLGMWCGGVVFTVIWEAELGVSAFGHWRSMLWGAAMVGIAAVLSVPVAMVAASIVLPPLYCARVRRNGGPFKVGDRVRVIRGSSPHFGRVAVVYSEWQHGSVRIRLGKEAEQKFEDVFSGHEVLRVSAEEEAQGSF